MSDLFLYLIIFSAGFIFGICAGVDIKKKSGNTSYRPPPSQPYHRTPPLLRDTSPKIASNVRGGQENKNSEKKEIERFLTYDGSEPKDE